MSTDNNTPRLIGIGPDKQVAAHVLRPGTVTLGRADDNDFTLDDNSISEHHARIVTFFNATYIEDLGSTNGTFVNGKKINQHTLHNGDMIRIGRSMLRFETGEAGHSDAPQQELSETA